jgi:hypothetical protein
MCFSATASFSAASITAAIGVATLRQVKRPRGLLLAAMPLLFASQQAIEGALWLQLSAGGSKEAVAALSLTFLVFAKVIWPAYVAPAVLLIEPCLRRRQALYAIAALGCAISIYMLNRLIGNPPPVAICGRSIDYGGHESALSWQTFLYLLSTCVPLLLSSSGAIRKFGAIVGAGFLVSVYTYFATFVSVWCFFAAAGSAILYFYFRGAGPPMPRPNPGQQFGAP